MVFDGSRIDPRLSGIDLDVFEDERVLRYIDEKFRREENWLALNIAVTWYWAWKSIKEKDITHRTM